MLEKLLSKNIYFENKISKFENDNINNKRKNLLNSKYFISELDEKDDNNINNKIYNNFNKNDNTKLTISQVSTNLRLQKSKEIKTKDDCIYDIFKFYAQQHNSIGSNGLLSELEKNMEHLNISEFFKFCEEFKIPISRQKSNEIFKKAITSVPSTYIKTNLMNFQEFIVGLKLLSNYLNQSRIEFYENSIKDERNKLKNLEMKQLKYKQTEKLNDEIKIHNKMTFNKSDFYFDCQKKKILNSIFNIENKYNVEKIKSEEEIINDFLKYLGINSKNEYKSKLKGFLLPFRTRGKKRTLTKIKNGIGSKLDKEIKEANKLYKLQKKEDKILSLSKEAIQKQILYKQKKKIYKINNEKLIKALDRKNNMKYSDLLADYAKKKEEKKKIMEEKKKKEEYEKKNIISWFRLENYDIKNLGINDKEMFEDNGDNSDDEILTKFSKKNENEIKQKKKSMSKTKSALELNSNTNNNLVLPPIKQYIPNKENNNYEFTYKKQETDNFENLSTITNNIPNNFSNDENN